MSMCQSDQLSSRFTPHPGWLADTFRPRPLQHLLSSRNPHASSTWYTVIPNTSCAVTHYSPHIRVVAGPSASRVQPMCTNSLTKNADLLSPLPHTRPSLLAAGRQRYVAAALGACWKLTANLSRPWWEEVAGRLPDRHACSRIDVIDQLHVVNGVISICTHCCLHRTLGPAQCGPKTGLALPANQQAWSMHVCQASIQQSTLVRQHTV